MIQTISRAETERFRTETAGTKNVNHLNNAGSALMPDVVRDAILQHIQLESELGGYEAAALQTPAIQAFYGLAARLLNCRAANIAFTASATDAYSRALSSIPFKSGDVILTSNDDYISNQIQFLSLQKRMGIRIEHISSAPVGGVDLNDLEMKLRTLKPRLLSITHIPTNSGLVQPVKEIGKIKAKYPDTIYLLDACQSVGQMKLDVRELNCDFLSVTCRKFLRGPRGTGFLYISDKILAAGLEPMFIDMRGADWKEKDVYQPAVDAKRFEDWEFPYALVIGSAVAIDYCLKVGEEKIRLRVQKLSSFLREALSKIPSVSVLDKGPELGGLVTFYVPGFEPKQLVQLLASHKINVVSSLRNFAVIDFDENQVDWAIRASPHYYNTEQELNEFVKLISTIVSREKKFDGALGIISVSGSGRRKADDQIIVYFFTLYFIKVSMSLRPFVSSADHIQGNPYAPVELVEYGDYQCPHCGRAYPLVKRLQAEMGDRLKFIFRNFPLANVHPQAVQAAMASEAAASQNNFWPMHDLLFENQRKLSRTAILVYAQSLNLDMEKFKTDISDEHLEKAIDLQFYGGMRSGVNVTPTFFINTIKLDASWEGEGLSVFIRQQFPELFL